MLLAIAAAAAAVAAPPFVQIDGVVYTRERVFQVPVELTTDEEAQAGAVRLWVSADGGKTWERKREQSPRKPSMKFVAPGDGTYDLALAVIGTNGRQTPERTEDLQSGLRVVVDATAPKLEAEIVESADGIRGVQWRAEDACPAKLLKAEMATYVEGQGWRAAAAPVRGAAAMWFRRGEKVAKAQVHVADAAGNAATIEIEIRGEAFRTHPVAAYALSKAPPPPGELDQAVAQRGAGLDLAGPAAPRLPRADRAVEPAGFAAPLEAKPAPEAKPAVAEPAPVAPPAEEVAPAGWKPRRKS